MALCVKSMALLNRVVRVEEHELSGESDYGTTPERGETFAVFKWDGFLFIYSSIYICLFDISSNYFKNSLAS